MKVRGILVVISMLAMLGTSSLPILASAYDGQTYTKNKVIIEKPNFGTLLEQNGLGTRLYTLEDLGIPINELDASSDYYMYQSYVQIDNVANENLHGYVVVKGDNTLEFIKEKTGLNGDINIDGILDVADIVKLQQYLHKGKALSAEQYINADINYDGTVNIFDLALIKRRLLQGDKGELAIEFNGDPAVVYVNEYDYVKQGIWAGGNWFMESIDGAMLTDINGTELLKLTPEELRNGSISYEFDYTKAYFLNVECTIKRDDNTEDKINASYKLDNRIHSWKFYCYLDRVGNGSWKSPIDSFKKPVEIGLAGDINGLEQILFTDEYVINLYDSIQNNAIEQDESGSTIFNRSIARRVKRITPEIFENQIFKLNNTDLFRYYIGLDLKENGEDGANEIIYTWDANNNTWVEVCRVSSTSDWSGLYSDDGINYTFRYNGEEFSLYFKDDTWHVNNSYKITDEADILMICDTLADLHPVPNKDYSGWRTPEDMAFEWEQHNIAYSLMPDRFIFKSNAKHVDINPSDQGKTLYDFYKQYASLIKIIG